jgi:L-2-hydroxyglutarate oxidase
MNYGIQDRETTMTGTGQKPVLIVGAGVVGLATALALAERGIAVLVLEAESELGAHQTGHNSGVIHSGLYYKSGSQRAETCRAGREALYAFCERHQVPVRRTGKLVVATAPDQIPQLDRLFERGTLNGLVGIQRLSGEELREREPEAAGVGALWVPQTGIVDYREVLQAMRKALAEQHVEVVTGERVIDVRQVTAGLTITTTQSTRQVKFLINCAGLQCDRIAQLCGLQSPIRIVPFKGEYYVLQPERAALVRNPIYPVPDPNLPFLGVHFTPRIDGRVEAGPNAVLAWARYGYSTAAFSARDSWDTLSWPGFLPMAAKHWRTALDEQLRSWSKDRFVRSLQELVPALQEADVIPAGWGIRAQAVDRQGALVDDFLIETGPRAIHVLNAPSPAATASLEIGRRIAKLAVGHPQW